MSRLDTSPELFAQRRAIATACRVLANRGIASGYLGHISQRVDDVRLLVRCRGPRERGLAFTEPEDIRLVDLDGHAAAAGELSDGYQVPNELPLHTQVLRARPDVVAVVHGHPEQVVTADLAGIRIRPVVGAYDIFGTQLAAGGVPVYPRSVLIRTRELADEMVAAMGSRPVVLLRGHGLASAGSSVAEAVLQAVSVNTIARISLAVTTAGGQLVDIPQRDFDLLPDLGPAFTEQLAWRHEIVMLTGAAPDPGD